MSLTHVLVSVAATALTQGEVHVHGHGTLAIGVDANGNAEALLDVPADSLWGFERAPRNAEEEAAIEAALTRLREPGLVMFSSRAGCELTAVNIDQGEVDGHDHHDHHDHSHDEHSHEDHGHDEHSHDDHAHDEHSHDEHAHDDHGHDHSHDHDHDHNKMLHHDHSHGGGDDHGHQDVSVQFVFECAAVEQINEISTGLFAAFPRLETIDGVYVDTERQTAFELSPSQTSFSLR